LANQEGGKGGEMKKTKATETKALRNRKAGRAIDALRNAWAEEPKRFRADIDELLLNTIQWSWPLRRYSPEERQAKEEKLRAELSKNRPILSLLVEGPTYREDTPVIRLWKKINEMLRRGTNEIGFGG
jgi:hypothetical protein